MRVPISHHDLIAGNGFKRLARSLQRDWLGEEPIALSAAQDLLARCFGYQGFHHVGKSAASPEELQNPPPLGTVLSTTVMTIASELLSGGRCGVYNHGELMTVVYGWPFLDLSVYRQQYGHADMALVSKKILAEQVTSFMGRETRQPERELKLADWELTSRQLQQGIREAAGIQPAGSEEKTDAPRRRRSGDKKILRSDT